MNRFAGIWIPLITPRRDDVVDHAALTRLVRHYLDAGVHGFVVCGTTGEPATLSAHERLQVLDCVLAAADTRAPVVMGISGNDTKSVVAAVQALAARPIAGVMLTAPYYTRPSQAGLHAHFSAVAASTDLPILLYNIPYRTGVCIDVDTVQRLSELPNVVAIKDSGGDLDRMMDLIRNTGMQVLCGEDHLIFPSLCLGAHGAIAAAAHLHPRRFVELYAAVGAGNLRAARALSYRLLPLVRALFCEPNPGPIKAALAAQGWISEELRLPMTAATAVGRARVLAALDAFQSCDAEPASGTLT